MTAPDPSPVRSRSVESVHPGLPSSDGAGVKLLRNLAPQLQQRLDPFLLLDEFRSDQAADYIGGFPDHPHRGFETITYMLAGHMLHQDSVGNRGNLGPGDVQWMTAARGVIHSEMPQQEEGLMHGFQLWLNLAAARKLDDPWYQDIPAASLGRVPLEGGGAVVVIAGTFGGVQGPAPARDTEPVYLDVHLPASGASFATPLPASHHAFLYVYQGRILVGGQEVAAQQLAVLGNEGDGVAVEAPAAARFLLLAGKPLHEPIVQMGPFVMNTRREIEQAFQDYQSGRLTR